MANHMYVFELRKMMVTGGDDLGVIDHLTTFAKELMERAVAESL